MSDDASMQLLVFRIGAELFGMRLADVYEVIDFPPTQPIPDAAPGVLGIASVRESFIVMYDPRPVLHVGGRIDGAALLFMHEHRRVAIAVGDVFDAMTVAHDEIRSLPLAGGSQLIITGVIRRATDLIAVVDTVALLKAVTSVNAGVTERQPT